MLGQPGNATNAGLFSFLDLPLRPLQGASSSPPKPYNFSRKINSFSLLEDGKREADITDGVNHLDKNLQNRVRKKRKCVGL